MSDELKNPVFDWDSAEEGDNSNLQPPPIGSYLTRLEVDDWAVLTKEGSSGYRVRAKVVEGEYRDRKIDATLWTTKPITIGRIETIVRNVAGVETRKDKPDAAKIKELLDGKLARVDVTATYYVEKGDNVTRYSEEDAADMRANGSKMYKKADVKWIFTAPTEAEIAQYGASQPRPNEKLPF